MQGTNKNPKLRFKNMSASWEEKRIGDVITEEKRLVYLHDDQEYQLVTVKRRNEGIVPRSNLLGKQILVKNYMQIKEGDYLISKRQIIHGANGVVPKNLDNAIVSNEYLVATSNDDIGVCQHSCHPYLNQATETSLALTRLDRRTGLRAVGSTGEQFLTALPFQRAGFTCFAITSTDSRLARISPSLSV